MLCDRIFNGVLIQAVLVRDPFKVFLVLREWTMILAHRRTLSVVGDHSYGGESMRAGRRRLWSVGVRTVQRFQSFGRDWVKNTIQVISKEPLERRGMIAPLSSCSAEIPT